MNYQLVNAEDRANKYFPMFQIPDRSTRRRLTVGMYAKIGFVDNGLRARGERMWVKITKVTCTSDPDTVDFEGTLENDPISFDEDELKRGDTIIFRPEHVMEWDVSEP